MRRKVDMSIAPIKGWDDRPSVAPVELPGNVTVLDVLDAGDVHTIYRCSHVMSGARIKGTFKVANMLADDDLTEKEVQTLAAVRKDLDQKNQAGYYPDLLLPSTCIWNGLSRRVSIGGYNEGLYSLKEVAAAYPTGVEIRHVAWMFNRLLEVLWFTHRTGRVHGAVLPTSVLVHAKDHGGLLTDWGFAEPVESKIKAIHPAYEAYYAPEILAGKHATAATDIYMAARTCLVLVGGDPVRGLVPKSVPDTLTGMLKSCMIANRDRRPQSAGDLREECGRLWRELFGKKEFVPFIMPAKA